MAVSAVRRVPSLRGWLAVFFVLVLVQVGHVFEHVAQMVQLHVFDLKGVQARGVIGNLDIEWVHFVWNIGILAALAALLVHFRDNSWLWAASIIAGWHALEHTLILSTYLTTGVAGTPGLLAAGGRIGGGLPIVRPDLHFLYNLIEIIPLLAAFVVEFARGVPGAYGVRARRVS